MSKYFFTDKHLATSVLKTLEHLFCARHVVLLELSELLKLVELTGMHGQKNPFAIIFGSCQCPLD